MTDDVLAYINQHLLACF